MKSVLLAAVLAIGAAAQLTIITPVPGAAECEPFLITWSGGTPPYFVTVQNNPPSGTPVVDFGQQSGTSLTWTVNATLGTSLIFQIKDSTGQPASSAPFTVTTGSDSCIGAGGGGSPGSSAAPGGSTAAPGGSTAAPGGSTAAPGGSTAAPGGTTAGAGGASSTKPSTTASAGNSTKSSGAAQAVGVPAGVFPAFLTVLGVGLIAALA